MDSEGQSKVRTTSKTVLGALLAYVSAFLFDMAHVINKSLGLNFNDSLLVRSVLQTVVFIVAIICCAVTDIANSNITASQELI